MHIARVAAAVIILSAFACAGSLSGHVKTPGLSVVMLDDGKPHPSTMPNAKIDQRGMRFVPVLLVVPVGTTVEFVNSDPAAHNVYWPNISGDKKLGHNLGTFPQGQGRSFKFDHPRQCASAVQRPSRDDWNADSGSNAILRAERPNLGRLLHRRGPGRYLQADHMARRQDKPTPKRTGKGRHQERPALTRHSFTSAEGPYKLEQMDLLFRQIVDRLHQVPACGW